MGESEMKNSNREGCNVYMRSKPPSVKHTFKWTVQNFSALPLREQVECPEFNILSLSEWKIILYQHVDLEVRLWRKSCGARVYVELVLFLYDCKGTLRYKCSEVANSIESSCTIGRISNSKLTQLPNDELIIVCLLKISKVSEFLSNWHDFSEPYDPNQNLKLLSQDLQKLLDDSSSADVTLKTSSGITIFAHKAILCSRSPVFAKMFEINMGEKKKNVIEITDMEVASLKNLLGYIYSGTISDKSFGSICDLHYAADKYALPDLQNECEKLLISQLEVDNACNVLLIADLHNNESLKKSAMTYIHCYLELIMKTPGWKVLTETNVSLAMDIMSLLPKKHSQK